MPQAEPTDMLGSLWEFPRARLRLQTVIIIIHQPPNHPHSVHLRFYNKQTNVHNSVHLKQIIQEIKTCNCSSIDVKLCQVLGEGNFGKVWKAEVDDICGYEGTILVAVKGVKASLKNKQTNKQTQTCKKIQTLHLLIRRHYTCRRYGK